MKAHPIEKPVNDKEQLSNLIDIMGLLDGGINQEEFLSVKEQMMNSGMSSENLMDLFETDLLKNLIQRPQIPVKIQRLTETAIIPTYGHNSDACADIYADEEVTIAPGETYAVSTGIALAILDGYVVHVYARSGLSMKTDLRIANSVGIIDAGYRDELKVLCWNSGKEPLLIEKGMRIAQMDIMQSPLIDFEEVDDIKAIEGDRMGGFGSTGLFDLLNDDEKEINAMEMKSSNGEI